MKLNSPESIRTAEQVFRSYGSWTAAREAATGRDSDGVLVIPKNGHDVQSSGSTPAGERRNLKAR